MYLKSESLVQNLYLENNSPLFFKEGDQFGKGKVFTNTGITNKVSPCEDTILQQNCMVWQSWPQKSSTKDYNFIPQMPSKFVERAFLVGGFVGSKSQAGSSPSRAQITLNDVILEQLLHLGLNLYTDIISRTNCDSRNKMISEKVPVQNFNNWRSNNMLSNKTMNSTSNYFKQYPGPKNCGFTNKKATTTRLPLTKHSQEELVYEDKDEGGNSIYVYQEVQKSTCQVTKTSMFHVRSRTISDCSIESDDSFIIFESNEDNDEAIGNEDVDVDEYEEDEEEEEEGEFDILEKCVFDDDDSSSDDECDEVDYLGQLECHSQADTPRINEANKKWNSSYNSVITSSKSPKKVSFANGKNLVQVRTMVVWDFALRAARKGPWEMLALDRSRFKTKIQQLSNIISPILEENHRKQIFHQRFQQASTS